MQRHEKGEVRHGKDRQAAFLASENGSRKAAVC
jgi:hypothetical protein